MTSLRPIDLEHLRIVGSPTFSPGGEIVASVQRCAGNARYAHRLWSFKSRADPGPLFADDGEWSDVGPRFSLDGEHLAFISDRADRRQAWLYRTKDGALSPIGDIPGSVRDLAWLGTDRLVAVVDAPAQPYEPGLPAQISWLRYKRDGRQTFFERPTQLWLLSVDGSSRLLIGFEGRVASMSVSDPWIAYALTPLYSDEVADRTEIRVFNVAAKREDLLLTSQAAIDEIAITDHGREILFVSAGSEDPSARQPPLTASVLIRPPAPR